METEIVNPPTFEEFREDMEFWSIPSSVVCVIRAENKNTGQVKEFSYQRAHAARKRLHQLLVEEEGWEVLIADDDAMSVVSAERPDGL